MTYPAIHCHNDHAPYISSPAATIAALKSMRSRKALNILPQYQFLGLLTCAAFRNAPDRRAVGKDGRSFEFGSANFSFLGDTGRVHGDEAARCAADTYTSRRTPRREENCAGADRLPPSFGRLPHSHLAAIGGDGARERAEFYLPD